MPKEGSKGNVSLGGPFFLTQAIVQLIYFFFLEVESDISSLGGRVQNWVGNVCGALQPFIHILQWP